MEKETKRLLFLKKAFFVFVAIDLVSLFLFGAALSGLFKTVSEYGQFMVAVASAIVIITLAVLLFEIAAKLYLIRSTATVYKKQSIRKGHIAAARLLLVFNLLTAVFCLLSTGGEGANLLNQLRLYFQILSSAAEAAAAILYLYTARAVRKIRQKEVV